MAEVLPGGVIVYYVYSTAANQEWFGGTHDACERDKLRRGGPQSVDPDVFCDVSYDVL